ncbi:MAG: CocE/NonD family hydrolase [Pseudomonadales bacterium]|jgi:putative CocE/NonD family hydrolase|nr:CocE/NonD family hydrolase [Pseudomonadales bacterium]
MRRVQARPSTTSGIDLPRIDVPALVCATWSDQGLHTRGSFGGFEQIASEQKWLFTHGRPKWDVYYSDEALAWQKDFFDHFLKGEDNGFEARPAVRLEVRESLREYSVRAASDWPLPGTDYTPLYLDAAGEALSLLPPEDAAAARYESETGAAVFSHTFDQDTELSGHMKLRLWVSAEAGEDMDLFVGVEKLDRAGEVVHFCAKTGYVKGPVAMGWLRASQRALDEARSRPWQPVLRRDEARPIAPGEIVPVDVEILPSSTLFRAGETLRLVVQGRDLFEHPALAHGYPVNEGVHAIHTGGAYDSHLLVPVVR